MPVVTKAYNKSADADQYIYMYTTLAVNPFE